MGPNTGHRPDLGSPAQALRPLGLGYGVVTDENGTGVLDMGYRLLDAASSVTDSLHGSDGESHYPELP